MKPKFTVLLVLSLLLLAGLATACALPYGWMDDYGGGVFESNGERIYFSAESSSGKPITYSGGFVMMHSRSTCADCHGSEGRGGRVSMMMWSFEVPDITWDNLTGEGHHEEPAGEEHEQHSPYDEESLRAAITEGINPADEPLDDGMPRWRMADDDLDDLVEFIKTLE